MTAPTPDGERLLTVEELAAATGLSVRTTRYYSTLGLLPAPVRRGRMAYYDTRHLARVELIRTLQDHGFTLAAIERRLADIPADADPDELAVHRALLTAWQPGQWEVVPRAGVDDRAGRRLDDDDLAWLTRVGAVRARGAQFQVLPLLRLAVELRDVGLPAEAVTDADAAVRRHMAALADELTGILRDRVLTRYHGGTGDPGELERVLANLRALTLDAIVASFQHAAAGLAARVAASPPAARQEPAAQQRRAASSAAAP